MVSPSAKRAWIEIPVLVLYLYTGTSSPSAKRAWIEIQSWHGSHRYWIVALCEEGVDRNDIG